MELVTVRALAKILAGGALAASLCGMCSSIAAAQAPASFLFVANNDSTVSTYSVDAATGSLTDTGVALIGPMSSSFALGLNPSQTLLYVGDNTGAGTWGFAIDAYTGTLTALAGSPFPVPYALSFAVDPAGGFFVVAGAGSVSSYRIDSETGDLALVSRVIGGTPWSLTIEPSGQYVYVANVNSNNVSGLRLNAETGELVAVAGSPFSAGANPVRVVADPSGRFLYVPNANGASLSAYRIDPDTGTLLPLLGSPFPTGAGPQAIVIDPSGSYVYVANFRNIDGFSLDADTGALTPLEGSPFIGGDSTALDLAADPSGQFVYAANHDAREVTVLALDPATGGLNWLSSAPSPGFPLAIALIGPPSDSPFTRFARQRHPTSRR